MVWEFIDQYIYISVLIIGLYFKLKNKNLTLTGIILLLVCITNIIPVINLLFSPITLIVSVVLIFDCLIDIIKNYQRMNNTNLKIMELGIGAFGLFLIILFFNKLTSIELIMAGKVITYFDFWLFIYASFLVYKSFVNLKEINYISDSKEELIEDEIVVIDAVDHQKEQYLITNKFDTVKNEEIMTKESKDNQINTSSNYRQVNQKRSINSNLPINLNDEKSIIIIFATLLILVTSLFYFMNFYGYEKFDVQAHSLEIYDHTSYTPELSMINGVDEYRKDGDYSKLYKEYEDYGYQAGEIDAIFEGLNSEIVEKLEKLDLSYEVSNSNVSDNQIVNINVTYDEEEAKKQKIKVINNNFDVVISDIPVVITSDNTVKDDFMVLNTKVESAAKNKDISFDSISLNKVYIEESATDSNQCILEYTLENGKEKSLGRYKDVEKIYVIADAYKMNDEIELVNDLTVSTKAVKISEDYVELS